MKVYKVQYLEDSIDCETCGSSFATGYIIECPDGEIIDRSPTAHCYDSVDYPIDGALKIILNKEKIILEEQYVYDGG